MCDLVGGKVIFKINSTAVTGITINCEFYEVIEDLILDDLVTDRFEAGCVGVVVQIYYFVQVVYEVLMCELRLITSFLRLQRQEINNK